MEPGLRRLDTRTEAAVSQRRDGLQCDRDDSRQRSGTPILTAGRSRLPTSRLPLLLRVQTGSLPWITILRDSLGRVRNNV
jgi:hypothetical protein